MIQTLLQQVQSANNENLLQSCKALAKEIKANKTELSTINDQLSDDQKIVLSHQLAIQFANEDISKSIQLAQSTINELSDSNSAKAIELKRYLGTIFIYTKRNKDAEQIFDEIFDATPEAAQDLDFLFEKWTTELKYKDQDEVLWQVWQAILDERIDFDTNSAKDLANKIFALYKGLPEELHRDHRRFSDHMFMHQNATKFTHLINYLAELDI